MKPQAEALLFSILSPQDKREQSKDVLDVANVSPIGKTWDNHRVDADTVADYYAFASKGYFNRYAQWTVTNPAESGT